MTDRKITVQLGISVVTTLLAVIIGVPALRRVPLEYALPLLISGALFGMSVMRAELAVRSRRAASRR